MNSGTFGLGILAALFFLLSLGWGDIFWRSIVKRWNHLTTLEFVWAFAMFVTPVISLIAIGFLLIVARESIEVQGKLNDIIAGSVALFIVAAIGILFLRGYHREYPS